MEKPTSKRKNTQFYCLIVFGLMLSGLLQAEQTQNQSETAPTEMTEKSSLKYSISNQQLSQNTKADEILWVDVNSNKHLVLWHRGKSRKERGNVLLLHAQGENAEHLRIIQPLTKQLVLLGWNLFIPNIAQEDFAKPVITNKENEDTEQSGDPEKKTVPTKEQESSQQQTTNETPKEEKQTIHFFKNGQGYQEYFSALYQAIFEQTEIAKLPTIIIANQNSAYWTIKSLDNGKLTPVIFLQPQLPDGITNDLDKIFALQTNPLFSFHITSKQADVFSKSFRKRLWRSKFQRFNTGMLSSSKVQEEDSVIAKTITGWVEKQRKK